MKSVAYVLAGFPTLTETFVIGEIGALRRHGIPIMLFALREIHSPIQQPEAVALRKEVGYVCALSRPRLVWVNVAWAWRDPGRYFRTWSFVVRGCLRNPVHLLKTLALFPKAVELADRMVRQGIGHVHAHWATYPTTVAMVISGLTGVSYSFTAHAWDISLIQTLLREKVGQARFVVTCTRENQNALRAMIPEREGRKIYLNYHGIPLNRFAGIDREGGGAVPVIMSCGALFERKGFADLVRACGILKRKGLSVRCVIIGEGPQRRTLEALVADEDVREEVTLAGALSQIEVIRQYARSDLFVLPCLARSLNLPDHEADVVKALEAWFEGKTSVIKDGIPNVLVEAMAMGIPVVSTNISGIPELVESGKNGLLVRPRQPKQLAETIERLLVDPALRRRLGECGAADVRRRFDRKKNASVLCEIFMRHLGEGTVPEGTGVTAAPQALTAEVVRES